MLIFTFTAALAESIGIFLFIPVIGQFGISAEIDSSENMIINILIELFAYFNIEFSLKNTLLLIA